MRGKKEGKKRVSEKGGPTLERLLLRPNPTATEGYSRSDSEGCKQEGGMKNKLSMK